MHLLHFKGELNGSLVVSNYLFDNCAHAFLQNLLLVTTVCKSNISRCAAVGVYCVAEHNAVQIWYTGVIVVIKTSMSIKNFIMKKAAERQLKDVPPEQRDMIMKLLENNPDLFAKMAKEVEQKVKKEGRDQQVAMLEVGKKYQKELREALGK